jgi:protoheme IX farnesyltransferase
MSDSNVVEVAEGEALAVERNLALYLDITRPRVMALVVFTGLPVLGMTTTTPSLLQAVAVLVGTALSGAASSAINAYLERDRDALMARTRGRPLPAALLLPRVVLGYGLVLAAIGTAILALAGGAFAAAVGLATILFYVVVYTIWLKPRTPQNIVIGGAAGATAPLIVGAAIDGVIPVGAWIMFAIIFLWTPPHFWAIALFRKPEYRNAGYPMMPLVVGDQPTRWRSLAYALLLIPASLLLVWAGALGWLYGASAIGLGVWFAGSVVVSMVRQTVVADRAVFRVSLAYLTFLFFAMLADLGLAAL